MKAISYGGGVQSTAMIVLATQGKIQADVALFANTGDDSENPETLTFVRNIMMPWSAERGVPVIELQRNVGREGNATLYQRLVSQENKNIHIPIGFENRKGKGNRKCTIEHKVQVIYSWLRERGARKRNQATVYVGISFDEIERLRDSSMVTYIKTEYPLVDMRLTRSHCMKIIEDAGLPVPPKSSCYFCPFHTAAQWKKMKRDKPELFQKAVELEEIINWKREKNGQDRVYLSPALIPLNQIEEAQQMLFSEELFCDTGHCMT